MLLNTIIPTPKLQEKEVIRNNYKRDPTEEKRLDFFLFTFKPFKVMLRVRRPLFLTIQETRHLMRLFCQILKLLSRCPLQT